MTAVHVTGRAAGKTQRTIEWLRENPDAVLVCHNERAASDLAKQNPDLAHRILGPHNARQALRGRTRVAVDNADLLLAYFLGHVPARMTVTGSMLDPATGRPPVPWLCEMPGHRPCTEADPHEFCQMRREAGVQ